MQQLRFVELDESGHLLLEDDDGTRYAVPVDDHLRAALRPRPKVTAGERASSVVTPREVQSMIRAGQTAEEVASATGWEVERVRRFEGPVLAEREHVVGLAQRAPVRAQGRTDGSHVLDRRVRERLAGRDVDLADVSWDAARTAAHGPWTVQVIFSAGGRERRAAWHYEVTTRALEALDDEARWLSEDEQALPGGLAGHPLLGSGHGEDEAAAELMATMRERRQRRSKRARREGVGTGSAAAHLTGQQTMSDEVLPLEDLDYDPDTMGDPPAAHPREAVTGESEGAEADTEVDTGAVETQAEAETETQAATETEPKAPEDQAPGTKEAPARPAKTRRQRRRLRMPKLPAAVDLPVDDEQPETEPEVSYARTRHPHEVSFDEFFGTEDEFDDEDQADDEAQFGDEGQFEDEGQFDEAAQFEDADDDLFDEQEEHDVEPADTTAADDTNAGTTAADTSTDEALSSRAGDDADGEDAPDDSSEDAADSPAESTRPADEPSLFDTDEGDEPAAASEADSQTEREGPATPSRGPAKPRQSSSRKGRTSVPSWDDIMFGTGDRRR